MVGLCGAARFFTKQRGVSHCEILWFFLKVVGFRGGVYAAASGLGCLPAVLGFFCDVIGLLGLPLCGAALTFFAAAKKVSKESGLTPPAFKRVSRTVAVVVHLESVFSHIRRE
jgi:hypothetical protein